MVAPGDEIAAGARSDSRLRASDADREHVIDVLKTAFVQDRVAKEEFDLRVGLALSAQTYGDLNFLTADIPAGLAIVQPAVQPAVQPPVHPPRKPARVREKAPAAAKLSPVDRAVVGTASFAMLAWIVALFAGTDAALPFLIGMASAFVSLFLLAAPGLKARRQNRSGPTPPEQRAVDSGSGAAYRVPPAGPARQLPGVGKPRRQGKADATRPPRLAGASLLPTA